MKLSRIAALGAAALVCSPLAVTEAVANPMPSLAHPTVARLADVNVNLGMSTKVTAPVTGATSYEWQLYTAKTGWTRLAKGGTTYRTISLTGGPSRHMNRIRVIAANSAGRVTSNYSVIRVWGINRSYPAKQGSVVRTGGWQVSIPTTRYGADEYGFLGGMETKVTVKKLASPAARPWLTIDLNYVDTRNIEHTGYPMSCSGYSPDLMDVTRLGAGQSAAGWVCADELGATAARGGVWRVDALPSESAYQPGQPAFFRGA